MKVAIYARYSSDNQRDASIADQFRVCRDFVRRQSWRIEQEYADHAVSGATLLRPGIQALLCDALAGRFDVVFAESLDRFSRDQEDTAGLFKRLTFKGVRIITLAEGDITSLHIGFKGTMNALFLKDLAEKTHRGLRGRVEAGKSGGGLCYGYRIVRAVGANPVTGELAIQPDEAEVVERIFREYATGRSPQAIAKQLNGERVPGPGGRTWGPTTLHGHTKRGTGILNNELYLGRRVWNRLRYLKDPDTGRRISRLNSQSEWVVCDVPELRILSDEAWQAVKVRQQQMRQIIGIGGNLRRATRPLFLFSGLIRCGTCRSTYVKCGTHRLACSGRRERGICTNALTITMEEVEERVLSALQTRFFESGGFEAFCEEFTSAVNQARMEHSANVSSAKRELMQLEVRRKKLIECILQGVPGAEVKDEMIAMAARREDITRLLESTPLPPPLLHPDMAALWREQITELRDALAENRCDPEAREAVRQMVEEIRLSPHEGVLAVDVKGNLAAMLSAASPDEDWQRQLTLVAGARNQ